MIKLHGSGIIFSKNFVDKYKGFYPHTFLYCEEDILHVIAKRDDLKVIYSPSIKIIHKEDSSTNALKLSKAARRRFYYSHFVNSAQHLLKLMKEHE